MASVLSQTSFSVSRFKKSHLALAIVIICVPWMLIAKPYLQWREHNAYVKERKLRGDVELQAVNPYQVFNDVKQLRFNLH